MKFSRVDTREKNRKVTDIKIRDDISNQEMSTKAQVLDFITHRRKRPDMVIGSVETSDEDMWVAKIDGDKIKLYQATIKFNPGLSQTFYEIISNAVDNKWRTDNDLATESPRSIAPMTFIEVTVNRETGSIVVKNDGIHIPCEKETFEFVDPHTNAKSKKVLYPAELFFGYDMSGTNYDDKEERKTSGRNGIGAKASNIFSSVFIVEHADPISKKQFRQQYGEMGQPGPAMGKRGTPEITPYKGTKPWTQITFTPDYAYFGYPGMDDSYIAVITKYCVDAAMITGLRVKLTVDSVDSPISADIKIPSLTKYAELFFENRVQMMHFETGEGECVLVDTSTMNEPDSDTLDEIPHLSWVNGVFTRDGGVHVDAWRDTIVVPFVKAFNARKPKSSKTPTIKTSAKETYPYLRLFVRVELSNPKFSQQTKDKLTSPKPNMAGKDGAKLVSEEEIKKLLKWNFVGLLDSKLQFKAERAIAKKDGANRTISLGDKLLDANFAGKERRLECTLFLTEGLSAKTFAVAGVSVMEGGTDLFGALALRGVPLNIRTATALQIKDNEEIQGLQTTLGLIPGTDYSLEENFATLRYGHVCTLTDADDDGIHIRGLLYAFFYTRYPTLFARKGFLSSMSTPVVRIYSSVRATSFTEEFYSNVDYQQWIAKGGRARGHTDYKKGLGSFGVIDAPSVFQNRKIIELTLEGDESEYVPLGFDRTEADARKLWITRDMKENNEFGELIKPVQEELASTFFVEGDLGLSTFVDTQLRIFAKMTLRRALPSLIDGMKESHRKAVYGILSQKLKAPATVEQIAGKVKEIAGYHHGNASLEDAIIGMAEGYVGANNIPLLMNNGMVGSRMGGRRPGGSTVSLGGDAAHARYVKTMPEPITAAIFCSDDEAILQPMMEDGKEVEPRFYLPVIPIALVNGATGITNAGYSTEIPCYNPKDIVKWLRVKLTGEGEYPTLMPWYRGFTGEITPMYDTAGKVNGWESKGILEKGERANEWRVRELPVGVATNAFKAYVEDKLQNVKSKDGKTRNFIKNMRWHGTPNTVDYVLEASRDFTPDVNTKGNMMILKNTNSLRNMVLLNPFGYPVKYTSPEAIIEDFFTVRIFFYGKRREYLINELAKRARVARSKAKFITLINKGKLDLRGRPVVDSILDIEKHGLPKEGEVGKENYDYLIDMPLRSQTKERAAQLLEEAEKLEARLAEVKATTAKQMWLNDIDEFETQYEKFLKERCDDVKLDPKARRGAAASTGAKSRARSASRPKTVKRVRKTSP